MLASPTPGFQPEHHDYNNFLNSSASVSGPFACHNGMADHTTAPPATKKPKLSLQTTSLPITFGKSSTALTVNASGVENATPTVQNTFTNAYSIPHRPPPNPAAASPTPFRHQSSPVSASRNKSSLLSRRPSHPYPYQHSVLGLKPILRNSPIPRPARSAITNSASPATTRRVFFPPAKRVRFRPASGLEEEIRTSRYLARHSDLSSDSDSDSDNGEHLEDAIETNPITAIEAEYTSGESPILGDADDADLSASRKRKSRQIEAVELRENRPESTHMRTRKYSSRRKRRRWEWTLAPLNGGLS